MGLSWEVEMELGSQVRLLWIGREREGGWGGGGEGGRGGEEAGWAEGKVR